MSPWVGGGGGGGPGGAGAPVNGNSMAIWVTRILAWAANALPAASSIASWVTRACCALPPWRRDSTRIWVMRIMVAVARLLYACRLASPRLALG